MVGKLKLSEAEEKARIATRRALEKYEIPSSLLGQVVLTTIFEGDDREFVLYVPGEVRDNPTIISRTRVNVRSGSVQVEVPGWKLKAA